MRIELIRETQGKWIDEMMLIDDIIYEPIVIIDEVHEKLKEGIGRYLRRYRGRDYAKYLEGIKKNKEVLEGYRKERKKFRFKQERIEIHRVSLENNRILLA